MTARNQMNILYSHPIRIYIVCYLSTCKLYAGLYERKPIGGLTIKFHRNTPVLMKTIDFYLKIENLLKTIQNPNGKTMANREWHIVWQISFLSGILFKL